MVALRLDPRLQGRVDASDVIQEGYLAAMRRLDEFIRDPSVPFYIWLRFLVGQRVQEHHRRHLDTPGRDVTAELERFGIPMTLDYQAIADQLMALSDEDKAAIKATGIADFSEADPSIDYPAEAFGMWSIITRYHWTQTFPAGAEVRISHSYTNRPPGGLFYWSNPPEDYQTYLVDQY